MQGNLWLRNLKEPKVEVHFLPEVRERGLKPLEDGNETIKYHGA